MQARDASGAARKVGGDAVKVSVRGASSPMATVIDNGNGTYNISYVPTRTGIHFVDVSVLSCPIQGSPFQVNVSASMSCAACVIFL